MITVPRTFDAVRVSSVSTGAAGAHRTSRQITIRSTQMSHLMHEELARAHMNQRLEQAEHDRLALYVVRLAKARRHARKARRQAEQAQLRLRLLAS